MSSISEMEPINVKLKFKTGFIIGSGYGLAGLLDDTVIRDERGFPFIPGTTLKGIIRQACVEIALIKRYPLYENMVLELAALTEKDKELNLRNNFSSITQIFGTSFLPASFEFTSAIPELNNADMEKFARMASVWSESHNSINSQTGTAKKDHLFTHEVAQVNEIADLDFHFSIRPLYGDIDDSLVSLLLCGIRFADRIGAKKSRGKGVVDMQIQPPHGGEGCEKKLKELIEQTFGEA